MRLLIDANIILDVLQKREPYFADSSVVWKLCETAKAEGYVSALTFANIVYIMRKELAPQRVEEVLKILSLIFRLEDFTAEDVKKTAELRWSDFEDAVQSVTASRIKADYIITRNVKDFMSSKVPAVTPAKWLAG